MHSCLVLKHHATNTCRKMELKHDKCLTMALYGGEWSAAHSGSFILKNEFFLKPIG